MSAMYQLERLQKAIETGMRPEEQVDLRDIAKRIKLLENYDTFGAQPAIRDFREWAYRDIRSINERLSTERILAEDGHGAERLAMMERKDVLLYLLGLFDPSTELETIEKELANRADAFEQYSRGM